MSVPPAVAKRTWYPPIEPFQKGFFRVSDIHELYYEQSGFFCFFRFFFFCRNIRFLKNLFLKIKQRQP